MKISKFSTMGFNTIAKKGVLDKEMTLASDIAVFVCALPISSHNMLIYVIDYLSKYTYISNSSSFSEISLKLINTYFLRRI